MRFARIALVITATAALVAFAGCGGGGVGGGNPGSTSYLPMSVGNTWDYTLTLASDLVPVQVDQSRQFPYHETVTGTATLGETAYYVIETVREAAHGFEESRFQQFRRVDDEAVYARASVRDPESGLVVKTYDLPFLQLPPVEGETWQDPEFPDTTFTTVSTSERVTVPAGTFTCVRVDQESDFVPEGEEDPVHFVVSTWYAQGVGIVKDATREDDVLTSKLELLSYVVN